MPIYAAAEEADAGGAASVTSFFMGTEEIKVSGQATAEDPLRVETAAQLAAFAWCLNNNKLPSGFPSQPHLLLVNDIDLSEYCSGAGWTPIGTDEGHAFQGVFDGGGHAITGLFINGSQTYSGLFGYLCGTVQNLKLEEVSITSTGHDFFAGGIAGCIKNGTVMGCVVTGQITADNAGSIAGKTKDASIQSCAGGALITGVTFCGGGIVGKMDGGVVKVCVNAGAIFSETIGGGIVGSVTSGQISNCLNTGAIEVWREERGTAGTAGGIAAHSNGTVEKCLNTANVISKGSSAIAGGIIGMAGVGSRTVDCVMTGRRVRADRNNAGCVIGTIFGGVLENCYADLNTTPSGRSNIFMEERDGRIAEPLSSQMWMYWIDFDPSIWTISDGSLPYITAFPDYVPLMSSPPDTGDSGDYEPIDLPIVTAVEIPDTGEYASLTWPVCLLAAAILAGIVQVRKMRKAS